MSQPQGWLRLDRIAFALTVVAVLSSALHFWPFEGSRLWELCGPVNGAVLAWLVAAMIACIVARSTAPLKTTLPHHSVCAFVGVCAMSVAFSPDPGRTVIFVSKLFIAYIGAYTMFRCAITTEKRLQVVYRLLAVAVLLSVGACLVSRWAFGAKTWGFFDNSHKYGSYIAMLVPMCSIVLFAIAKPYCKVLGGLILIGGVVSAGTIGSVTAIGTGAIVGILLARGLNIRVFLVVAAICAATSMVVLWPTKAMAPLRTDIAVRESDGNNIKQRYIEWQALLNLVGDRTAMGTGVGCVNTYRSSYYGRMPKLNTLDTFEQNGWLNTAAGAGIFGLMTFVWVFVHHLRLMVIGARHKASGGESQTRAYCVANLAGLSAAGIANAFSSIHNNGVLVIFVLMLALAQACWSVGGSYK